MSDYAGRHGQFTHPGRCLGTTVTGNPFRGLRRAPVLGVLGVLCSMVTCVSSAAPGKVVENPPQHTLTQLRALEKPRPERVLVVGDSLSTGLGTTAEEAWPSQLSKDLQSGQQPVTVINAAANGAGYLTAGGIRGDLWITDRSQS